MSGPGHDSGPGPDGLASGPGPIIPAGMPPGTAYAPEERAPEGVVYFRIFGALFAAMHALLAIFGASMFFSPFWLPGIRHSGDELNLWIAGVFYGGLGLACLTPTLIALFAPRRPWAHTLGTVVIALGMFNLCCIPVLIPVLIVWMKPETKQWYGAR